MNTISLKNNGFEQRVQALADGFTKPLPTTLNLVVNKTGWSSAEIEQKLQGYLQLFADVRDARAAVSQKLSTLHQGLTEAHGYCTSLARALEGYFGQGNAELLQFGISLGKRRALTSEQKSIARAKTLRTRTVRHTLGRKQRLALGVTPPTVLVLGPDGKPLSSSTAETPSTVAEHEGVIAGVVPKAGG